MGNTRSQPCRRGKPQYLLYLIHRTWSIVADRRRDRARSYATDRETDLSSRCSECNAFDHGQSSLTFDSESDMAPNAEEELLVLKPWGPRPEKERLRPPTYNAEDYAIALRRWGRRPVGSVQESQGTLPSTTSSSSGYASGTGEMTLRQFTSVSELLNKLRADLRLAFPSFVQEFASPPADGIALLLETLRGVQLAQSSPPSSAGHAGPPRVGTRRAALDELGCVECLAACTERCSDAPRLLVQAQPGLLALTVCLTSSLNRSRVLALQLLTKVCQTPGGHAAVSEAVSTLRLRYGEGGRFRFLAGALSAPRAAIALRVAGLSFLNAFLKSAPRTQTRLYIQAEACEAGLEPQVLREWLKELDGREEDALNDLLRKEVQKWARNCVDVDALQRRVVRAEETCRILGKKISTLQAQLQLQQLDKLNDYSLDDREKMAVLGTNQSPKTSSNAEDEGISSSERSSSPENAKRQQRASRRQRAQTASSPDNDQETTIDDVIEELRIIVQDAEEEIGGEKREKRETEREKPFEKEADDDGKGPNSNAASNVSRSVTRGERVTYFGNDYGADSGGGDRTVKIVVKGPDAEDAIVPTILHPQPPRRSPPCLSAVMALRQHSDFTEHEEMYNSHDDYVEEDTLGDGSDSLLSASRLKYRGKSETAAPEEEIRKREFGQRAGKSCDDLRHFDEASDAKGKGPIGKLRAEQTGFYQSRSSKCKSEVEKKKQLRRSTSHDYLESNASSPRYGRSNGGRVENRIRKFESLNSFDDRQSLRTYERQGSSEYGSGNNGMRRSESFHHVSTQGGSDSGLLFYVTDFDLEPLVTRRSRSIDAPKSPTLLTKSLDRIDEGLDSIVDIVITEEKGDWNGKNGKCLSKMKKSRDDDKTSRGRRVESRRKHLRSDELRSDELYEEKHRREWMSVEAGFRDRAPAILANGGTRHDSFRHNEGMGSGRLSKSMDSGIFAGRTYDTFGLGKSRFNAGKYSGGRRAKESPIGRRNTTSSAAGSRGKVTDVVSGLY